MLFGVPATGVRRTSDLINVSSRRGFSSGAVLRPGVIISLRPSRRWSGIGMRMMQVWPWTERRPRDQLAPAV
jgi:hypothetical protein